MEKKEFISGMNEKDTINSVFIAYDKAVHTGKNSKKYISLNLKDISGTIDARVWDNIDDIDGNFESGDFVKVKGTVKNFQNRKQFVVHTISKALKEEYNIQDLLRAAEKPAEEMFVELMTIVDQVKNPHIKQLIKMVIEDKENKEKILKCPAAKTIHHAYMGGLLEHILSICKLMQFLSSHYKTLNGDLLIFGAIFHDIGKIWELNIDNGITYTDSGRLVGHLVMASELVEKTASKILGFPEDLKNVCKHIVLSHHGRLEYGSPKRPKLLEAFVVAAIDDFDSKMNTIGGFIESEKLNGEKWSKFNSSFGRYFYLDSMLGDEASDAE